MELPGRTFKSGRAVLYGAGDEIRTRDIYLGKVVLYQLSYSRTCRQLYGRTRLAIKFAGQSQQPAVLPPSAQLLTADKDSRVIPGLHLYK